MTYLVLEHINENRNRNAVDKIRKHTANNRHQQIRLNRGHKFIRQGLHISHSVWRCAHPKAAGAGGQHSGVIIPAHHVILESAQEIMVPKPIAIAI